MRLSAITQTIAENAGNHGSLQPLEPYQDMARQRRASPPAKWGVPVDFLAPEVYIYLLRILQANSPSPTMAFEVANPRRNRIDAVGVSVDIIIGEVRP